MPNLLLRELSDNEVCVVVLIRCGRFDRRTASDCGRLMGNVRVVLPAEGHAFVFDMVRSRRLGRGQTPLPGSAVVGELRREGITWDPVGQGATAVTLRCAKCQARPVLSRSRLGAEAIRRAIAGPLVNDDAVPWLFSTTLRIGPGGEVLHRPATLPPQRREPLQDNGSGTGCAVVKHRSARVDVEVVGQQQTVAPAERQLSGAWPTTTGG